MKKGFTLIEIMVIMGIMGVIGVAVASIFLTTSKSTMKTKVINDLKQQGDSAMSIMEKIIRSAGSIENMATVCNGAARQDLTIYDLGNNSARFYCDDSADRIASQAATTNYLIADDEVEIDCSNFITCNLTGGNPEVTIRFSLTKGDSANPDNQATVEFKSTVVPRNF